MSDQEPQPKITLLPSEQIIAAENAVHNVTDSKGRVIAIKKPGILAQFDLIEVLGDVAENHVYRVMCLPILYVVSIDGDPVMKIGSNREMRALIERLDEHGMAAIQAGIAEHFRPKAKPEGGVEEAVKK